MSTLLNGSGWRPSGRWSNSMNTRFQISSQRGHVSLWSGMQCGPSENCVAAVEVDLAARPAGPGLGHPPEVLVVAGVDVAPLRHPLRRQADLVAPDVPGDLVVGVGRRGQPLRRDAEVLRQEAPRPEDRVALEVVAEAPVAEHLEERVMPRRPADLLEVVVLAGDAQDALVVDRAVVGALLGAGEDVLELDHAGVREEERLVAGRNEARAGHDRVTRAPRSSRETAGGSRPRAACLILASWVTGGLGIGRNGTERTIDGPGRPGGRAERSPPPARVRQRPP